MDDLLHRNYINEDQIILNEEYMEYLFDKFDIEELISFYQFYKESKKSDIMFTLKEVLSKKIKTLQLQDLIQEVQDGDKNLVHRIIIQLEDNGVQVDKSWWSKNKDKLQHQLAFNFIGNQVYRSYLPKGTKIYHGTLNKIKFKQDGHMFFGIDPEISFWILTEHSKKQHYGYLYEFEIKSDLPVLFNLEEALRAEDLSDDLAKYCRDTIPCLQKIGMPKYDSKGLCLEPFNQELVLPYRFIKEYLDYWRCYQIDIEMLRNNCRNAEFDFYQAIVSTIDIENPLH